MKKKLVPDIEPESSEESEEEDVPAVKKKKHKQVRIVTPEEEGSEDGFPELPFEQTPAVAYVPLGHSKRPQWGPIPNIETRVPAYKNRAPIEDESLHLEVILKMLGTPVTITAEDLLGVSKPLREELKKIISRKRMPVVAKAKEKSVSLQSEQSEQHKEEEDALAYWETFFENQELVMSDGMDINDLPMATFSVTTSAKGEVPAGSVVLDDPVLQYYDSLEPGETPQTIYVARESQGLRTIYPVINKSLEEEAVLDGGSQIVSMSKAVALKLGLAWNPDIVIHMQSANKQVEKTLGLARNVPFLFKEITLYLQVHIVNEPAYKVLLGRPFDALTESVIQNDRDGGQLITIKDPNTGRRATLPTYHRGQPPETLKRTTTNDVFQCSMN